MTLPESNQEQTGPGVYLFINSSILPLWDEILVTRRRQDLRSNLGSTIKRALMVQVIGFIRLDCFSD
jgi:hypothetical protein